MEIFLPHFATHLRGSNVDPVAATEKARHIACSSMRIERRYFVRELSNLHKPLTPRKQCEMFVETGLKMAIPTIQQALENADTSSGDINCIVYVSHQPFPSPPFTAYLMSAMQFHRDCSQIPVTTLGCAGGAFALDVARTYLTAHPTHRVLVLSVELCSLGFRPHKDGMSWFINAALFGDAVAAFVVRGGECLLGENKLCMQLIGSKQRLVPDTTDDIYFEYDEWGYHFITTPKLCKVIKKHCPLFAVDLSQESFAKQPSELALCILHQGGTRIIDDMCNVLNLTGSHGHQLAEQCIADGGNTASASVIDMFVRTWDVLNDGDQLICVGMGPGFVMCGASLKVMASRSNILNGLNFLIH